MSIWKKSIALKTWISSETVTEFLNFCFEQSSLQLFSHFIRLQTPEVYNVIVLNQLWLQFMYQAMNLLVVDAAVAPDIEKKSNLVFCVALAYLLLGILISTLLYALNYSQFIDRTTVKETIRKIVFVVSLLSWYCKYTGEYAAFSIRSGGEAENSLPTTAICIASYSEIL